MNYEETYLWIIKTDRFNAKGNFYLFEGNTHEVKRHLIELVQDDYRKHPENFASSSVLPKDIRFNCNYSELKAFSYFKYQGRRVRNEYVAKLYDKKNIRHPKKIYDYKKLGLDLKFENLFLLTKEEYEKFKKNIPYLGDWWLNTPGEVEGTAYLVSQFEEREFEIVDTNRRKSNMRPAIKFENPALLKEGEKFSIGDKYIFTVIGENVAICDTFPLEAEEFSPSVSVPMDFLRILRKKKEE